LTNDDIKKHYLQIVELLLLNDTDKNIVRLYLNFIKENEGFIIANKLNTFQQELTKYKRLFTVEEMNIIKKDYKTQSEKMNFIDYLKKLSESTDYNGIYREAKEEKKNSYLFNFPIEFSNQELFYYKSYILLIREIVKSSKYPEIFNEYIKERIEIAKMVINSNILSNIEIVNNEDKMNILILLILFDKLNDENESFNFNRLLQTQKVNKQQIEEYVYQNNLGKITELKSGNFLIENEEKKSAIYFNINSICLKNLKNLILKPGPNSIFFNFKRSNYLNILNDLLINNEISLYIDKIRLLLVKFIHSNVYKDAIKKLFPNYFKYLLDDNLNDMEIYINSRLKFYPYQDLSNSGLTDKFSFLSYIPIIFPFDDLEDKISFALKISATVDNSIHEMNHINQDILYFKENNISMLHTPKREGFKTGKEGGNNLEEILFGRKIVRIGFLESLYILNEKNFEQDLDNYKMNFLNLYSYTIDFKKKKKFLDIPKNGIFGELFQNIDNYIKEASKDRKKYSMNTKIKDVELGEEAIYINRGISCCIGV